MYLSEFVTIILRSFPKLKLQWTLPEPQCTTTTPATHPAHARNRIFVLPCFLFKGKPKLTNATVINQLEQQTTPEKTQALPWHKIGQKIPSVMPTSFLVG